MSVLIEMVKDWQTLVVGIMALIAAFLTIRAIRRQISIQEEQFDTISERKLWAARARMPGALSEFSSYCSAATTALLAQDGICPKPPTNAVATLIDSMEYIEKNAANRVAKIVQEIQVHNARIEGHFDPNSRVSVQMHHVAHMLFDTAILNTYINSLFEYARQESESGPDSEPTNADSHTGLTNAIGLAKFEWNNPVYLEAVEIINRRHPVDNVQ